MNEHNPNILFLQALCLLLIGLKLAGIITLPWIGVLAPVWVPFAFVFFTICVEATFKTFFRR